MELSVKAVADHCGETTCGEATYALNSVVSWCSARQQATKTSSNFGQPGASRKRSGCSVSCPNSQICNVPGCCPPVQTMPRARLRYWTSRPRHEVMRENTLPTESHKRGVHPNCGTIQVPQQRSHAWLARAVRLPAANNHEFRSPGIELGGRTFFSRTFSVRRRIVGLDRRRW